MKQLKLHGKHRRRRMYSQTCPRSLCYQTTLFFIFYWLVYPPLSRSPFLQTSLARLLPGLRALDMWVFATNGSNWGCSSIEVVVACECGRRRSSNAAGEKWWRLSFRINIIWFPCRLCRTYILWLVRLLLVITAHPLSLACGTVSRRAVFTCTHSLTLREVVPAWPGSLYQASCTEGTFFYIKVNAICTSFYQLTHWCCVGH